MLAHKARLVKAQNALELVPSCHIDFEACAPSISVFNGLNVLGIKRAT